MTPLSGTEKKQVLHFCALGSDEMQKFVEDLKESIAEVTELEQIRIECKDLGVSKGQFIGRHDPDFQEQTHSALAPLWTLCSSPSLPSQPHCNITVSLRLK